MICSLWHFHTYCLVDPLPALLAPLPATSSVPTVLLFTPMSHIFWYPPTPSFKTSPPTLGLFWFHNLHLPPSHIHTDINKLEARTYVWERACDTCVAWLPVAWATSLNIVFCSSMFSYTFHFSLYLKNHYPIICWWISKLTWCFCYCD